MSSKCDRRVLRQRTGTSTVSQHKCGERDTSFRSLSSARAAREQHTFVCAPCDRYQIGSNQRKQRFEQNAMRVLRLQDRIFEPDSENKAYLVGSAGRVNPDVHGRIIAISAHYCSHLAIVNDTKSTLSGQQVSVDLRPGPKYSSLPPFPKRFCDTRAAVGRLEVDAPRFADCARCSAFSLEPTASVGAAIVGCVSCTQLYCTVPRP